jgi:hypothetical protein
MALSVFAHDEECVPPSNLVNLAYDVTSPNNLDNSVAVNTYSIDGALDINSVITQPVECGGGMDIVFLVDYTGSMGSAIDGVKAGISNILSTINTESNGDFRVALCLFDEYNASNTTIPSYKNTAAYQAIPSSNKVIIETNISKKQAITGLIPFGGIGSTSDFQTKLSLLNTPSLPLGNGAGSPEPGGLAVNEIVSNSIVGSFRAEAIKVIVLITDNIPGGDDDSNNSIDQSYFNNTLIGLCDSFDVQVMVQSSRSKTYSGNYYADLADGTTPIGRYDQVTFDSNGNWVNNGLVPGIQSLCGDSFTPTCNFAESGWYYETGDYYSVYFDKTTGIVTNKYYFPAEYDVVVSGPTLTDISVGESGETITYNVTTKYVPNGTTLYWSFYNGPSTDANASDFINAISGGSFTINNNQGSFQLTTKADYITEGNEVINIKIMTGSTSGTIVALPDPVGLIDTTTQIPTPTPSPTPTATPTPTPTATPIPPTPTATAVPTGTCQTVWISFRVDQSRYGLQWRNPDGTTQRSRFNALLSAEYYYNGTNGSTFSVCTTLNPQVYDFTGNALVIIDDFVRLSTGGTCTSYLNCSPPFNPEPTPTATPVPPTATPRPTVVPPTATPVPPTATPVPPTATPAPTVASTPVPTSVPPTATPAPTVAATPVPTATPFPTLVPPTATPEPVIHTYLMDPCDGSGRYVIARSNTTISLYTVWQLTGSAYTDTPYTAVQYVPGEPWETTLGFETACPPSGGGGGKPGDGFEEEIAP